MKELDSSMCLNVRWSLGDQDPSVYDYGRMGFSEWRRAIGSSPIAKK